MVLPTSVFFKFWRLKLFQLITKKNIYFTIVWDLSKLKKSKASEISITTCNLSNIFLIETAFEKKVEKNTFHRINSLKLSNVFDDIEK